MALIERRRLMIDLSDEHLPRELVFDDDHANYVTVLLGQVINRCFGDDQNSFDISTCTAFEDNLRSWKDRLPDSFAPITMNDNNYNERGFPFIGTLHGWHGLSSAN